MWGFSGRDAAVAVIASVVAAYLVRLLDRVGPRFVALIAALVGSVFAAVVGLGPLQIGLIAFALFLLAHFVVLVAMFIGTFRDWRVPDAYTPNPNLLQRIFVQIAVTAVALFVLPFENVARVVQRVR
jgi:hypothetical protein